MSFFLSFFLFFFLRDELLMVLLHSKGFPGGSVGKVKCLPAMRESHVRSLGWEDPLEKEMATHSGILA